MHFACEKRVEGEKKGICSSWSQLNYSYQGEDSGKIMNFCLVTENCRYLGNWKKWKPMEESNTCV